MVAARSHDEIEAVAEALRAEGHEAHAQSCDVTDPEQVEALRDAATAKLGGAVDILVNNAGIASSAPLAKVTLEEWNRIFAVNVTGTFLCAQAFVPGMLEQGWGRVINVASVAGKFGGAYITAYAASKHAVVGFTRSLSAEVATKGVTVNAVCPGFVDTEMTDESIARITEVSGMAPERARRQLASLSPQRRLYTADEVAYQVLCLCPDEASGVNGQSLVLDGGTYQS